MILLILLAIQLTVWFLYVAAMISLAVPVIAIGAVVFLVQYVWIYLRAYSHALGVFGGGFARPVPQPAERPADGLQPAYPQYLFGPAGADLSHALRTARSRLAQRQTYFRMWITDRCFGPGQSGYRWGPGILLFVGLVLGSVLAAVLVGFSVLVQLVFWSLLFAGGLAMLYLLRLADTVLLRVRGIRPSCQTCHHPITYPAYACSSPSCSVRHVDIRPGRYGLTRRRCRCGATLPTLLLLGSHRLPAYCPVCHAPLSEKVGTQVEVVLPLFGAPGAGKTRLYTAIAMDMREMTNRHGLRAEPADEFTRREYDVMTPALRHGQPTRPTLNNALHGYSYRVTGARRAKRLLHIYDAPGERMRSSDQLQELRYMRLAQVFVFVVDPLSIGTVWQSLPPGRRAELRDTRSPDDPGYVFTQVLQNIEAMGVHTRERALAVAVTKRDLVAGEAILADVGGSSADIERWLSERVGLDHVVRAMRLAFTTVQFFWTSATMPGGAVDPSVGELTAWAMRTAGLPVR